MLSLFNFSSDLLGKCKLTGKHFSFFLKMMSELRSYVDNIFYRILGDEKQTIIRMYIFIYTVVLFGDSGGGTIPKILPFKLLLIHVFHSSMPTEIV